MALRRLMTATILLAAVSARGIHELETSNDGDAGSSDSDIASPANPKAASDVFSQGDKARFVGMNICGFDFGCNQKGFCDLSEIDAPLPDAPPAYTDPDDPLNNGTAQMVHFVAADNFNIFRLPVSWQYLVNNDLGGPLDPTNFGCYDQLVRGCLSTGAYCIVDLHNYARWGGKRIGEADGPSTAQFADLWRQVAACYRDDDRVWFGIMNEPYGLPSLSAWPKGDGDVLKQVTNPDGTAANLVFDAHLYLDARGSGTGKKCVTSGIEDHWAPLAEWLRENGRQAIVTETGGGDTPSCAKYLCQQLRYLE
ncbi:putative glycoside hydrolase family 5 protein [Diaporthe ampelina]|uniref:cellulase n=1 Tax=Diaporthe ampelina TaxID=1214573 RepID=A0A0G2FFM2_9PEZI|nr:putative glycoside hydrolase family 5 protein [Diaporthe ampelina]